jgi:hypothetical protein
MTLQEWGPWLEYANIPFTVVLAGRLYSQELYRAYHWFFTYLIYDLIETLLGLIPLRDPATVYRYLAGQTIKTALAALVVFEIYNLALAERKALARFSRNLVTYLFVGSFLVSATGLYASARTSGIHFPVLRYTLLLEGIMDSTLFLFLLAMAIFLVWFPVEIRRNIVVYIVGFEVYFFVRWVLLLLAIRRTAQWQVDLFNIISFAITYACIVFWTWGMRRSGELQRTTTGHRWNPEEMGRLRAQLDEINESLDRLARK